jgi:hypothetical protein
MPSEPAIALIGAGVGGVIGTCGTWLVSTRLERRRNNDRLRGVIGLLAAELEDNRNRIAARRAQATEEPEESEESEGHLLTIGNWDANKAAFSQLVRDEPLWNGVVRTYAAIFEAISERGDPPEPEQLDAVRRDLAAARKELTR